MEKGKYMEKCNRSSCLGIPATHYNHSTEKYYCKSCADAINRVNKIDAIRLFGHDVCTKGEFINK